MVKNTTLQQSQTDPPRMTDLRCYATPYCTRERSYAVCCTHSLPLMGSQIHGRVKKMWARNLGSSSLKRMQMEYPVYEIAVARDVQFLAVHPLSMSRQDNNKHMVTSIFTRRWRHSGFMILFVHSMKSGHSYFARAGQR